MSLKYENLYGDVAAFGLPTRIKPMRRLLNEPEYFSKVLYGSDLPVQTVPAGYIPRLGFLRGLELQFKEKNPFDQAYLTLKELGNS